MCSPLVSRLLFYSSVSRLRGASPGSRVLPGCSRSRFWECRAVAVVPVVFGLFVHGACAPEPPVSLFDIPRSQWTLDFLEDYADRDEPALEEPRTTTGEQRGGPEPRRSRSTPGGGIKCTGRGPWTRHPTTPFRTGRRSPRTTTGEQRGGPEPPGCRCGVLPDPPFGSVEHAIVHVALTLMNGINPLPAGAVRTLAQYPRRRNQMHRTRSLDKTSNYTVQNRPSLSENDNRRTTRRTRTTGMPMRGIAGSSFWFSRTRDCARRADADERHQPAAREGSPDARAVPPEAE